jgi:uncharacterized oligopeptide transporter (OPT) family protein
MSNALDTKKIPTNVIRLLVATVAAVILGQVLSQDNPLGGWSLVIILAAAAFEILLIVELWSRRRNRDTSV